MKKLILFLFVTACAVDPPAAPSPMHAVSWSATGQSDSPGEPTPIACTMLVSHPCPLLMYMREIAIAPVFDGNGAESLELTWQDGGGGADANGRSVETIAPVVEIVQVAHSALQLPDRGDDGGLRNATAITRDTNGVYRGDVSWYLFNVAGKTTWHLTLTPIESETP